MHCTAYVTIAVANAIVRAPFKNERKPIFASILLFLMKFHDKARIEVREEGVAFIHV